MKKLSKRPRKIHKKKSTTRQCSKLAKFKGKKNVQKQPEEKNEIILKEAIDILTADRLPLKK